MGHQVFFRLHRDRKALHRSSEYRGTYGIRFPAKEKFGGGTADPPLTRAHATSRMQLRRAPRRMLPDAPEFYIFTATDNRFGIDGGAKLLAKSERFAQQGGEAIEAALLRQQFCGAGG
ncbi:MAG: hypothetical protein WAL69_16295, partial [Candidatus Acidiferrales bacterium]